MIEETLLKSNYLGKDGFIWWLGQVAPPEVWDNPEKIGIDFTKNSQAWAYRCKVRIIGYHTYDRTELPDNDLPWAHVMVSPSDGNAQGGLGKTHKLVGGETVFGFFLDGDDSQQPVVIGSIYRNANTPNFDIDEIAFKPFSGSNYGRVTSGPTKGSKTNTISNFTSNPGVEVNLNEKKSPVGVAASSADSKDKFFPYDKALQQAYAGPNSVKIVSENGCDNNVIGKITRAIQDFIAVVNGIQGYLDTYIDPVLNVFVDIASEIRRTARTIVGTIKFLINNMRNVISKLIGCLFSKFVGLVIPIPQQPIVGEAAKNIINIIFCVFEKIIDRLLPFLENILQGLVGRALNAPLCAIEEVTAAILNKLLDIIDELLAPIMSGISWLVGGLSQVSSILSQATSIATEIFNLIGCDNLKCKTPSEWALKVGPSQSEYDNWNRVVGKMNVIRGFNDNLDVSLNSLSIFGGGSSPIFRDCANKVNNPQGQKDLVDIGIPQSTCIPPEIEIFGDGVGAKAIAVVGDDGSILSIRILTSGFGYSSPPNISIVDKSNYGSGAKAQAIIDGGRVTQIYLTSSGSGYCKTNLDVLNRLPYYIVTANKYSFYEGETCTFTISAENALDGTQLSYYLSGDVNSNDIEGEFSGNITIFNNTYSISFKIKQDNTLEQLEEMVFNLIDESDNLVAKTVVLINDRISPVLVPPDDDQIQSPPGTTIPVGFTTSLPIPPSLPIPTIPGPGIGTQNVGILTAIVIESPGIGYTSGDTISVGGTVIITPIVSPEGFIVGVGTGGIGGAINSLTEFSTLPDLSIDSNTGEGASLYPVIEYTPKVTSPPVISINDKGVIKVVDCV